MFHKFSNSTEGCIFFVTAILFLLRAVGWEGVAWMHLAQDMDQLWALVNTVMNIRGSIKGGEFLDQLSVS
jgi:hypothetical protein